MTDECLNCGTPFRGGSAFKAANERYSDKATSFINFINETSYPEFCTKCGEAPMDQAKTKVNSDLEAQMKFCENHVIDFPMFTVSWLPANAHIKLKNMVTANVTVGTGLFSEISQGVSDMFGAVNTETGMSFKVNKGEATARSILVMKATSMGANCIIGVDIDYGTTGNNAATVNMQGTAAVISNLDEILSEADFEKAKVYLAAREKVAQLRRWRTGDISA